MRRGENGAVGRIVLQFQEHVVTDLQVGVGRLRDLDFTMIANFQSNDRDPFRKRLFLFNPGYGNCLIGHDKASRGKTYVVLSHYTVEQQEGPTVSSSQSSLLPLRVFEERGHFMVELIQRGGGEDVVFFDETDLARGSHSHDVQGLAMMVLTAGCRQQVSQGFRGIPVGGE